MSAGPFRKGGYGFTVVQASSELLPSGRTRCHLVLAPEGSAVGTSEVVIPWAGGGETGVITPGPFSAGDPVTVEFEIGATVERVAFGAVELRYPPSAKSCEHIELSPKHARMVKVSSIKKQFVSIGSARCSFDITSPDGIGRHDAIWLEGFDALGENIDRTRLETETIRPGGTGYGQLPGDARAVRWRSMGWDGSE